MKGFLLTLILLLSISFANAQEGLHIGFYAVPQNTWILNTEDPNQDYKELQYEWTWGFAGMAKIGYNFGPPFGIHVGFIYSKQGQEHQSKDSTNRVIFSQRDLTYIKIPLLVHVSSDPGPVMMAAEFGPQIGLLQDAVHFEDGVQLNYNFTTTDLYRPTEFSFTWAIGVDFQLTEWFYFVLMHRGDYTFLDIENKNFSFQNDPYYSTARLKTDNLTLGLQAGIKFCIYPGGGGRNTRFWIR